MKTNGYFQQPLGEEALQELISTVSEEASLMQKAQHDVTRAIDGVVGQIQTVDASIEHAVVSIHGLDESIGRFDKTTELMHQTESNLVVISHGLAERLQRAPAPQPSSENESTKAFNDAMAQSQVALTLAQERRTLRGKMESIPKATM